MSKRHTLAIVGGGSISTSFLAQLAHKLADGSALKLIQFEPAEALGVGMPYRPDLDSVLLNTPAGALSVLSHEPAHFVDWIRYRGGATPSYLRFLAQQIPRSVYGEYLADTYQRAVDALRKRGASLSIVRDRVVDMERCDTGVSIHTEKSGRHLADEAVLCTGNLPASAFRELIGRPGYFHSPYPCSEVLQQAMHADHIGVAGTSLSAVDTIVSLFDTGYRGRITAFSRRGLLPSVRSRDTSDFELQWFTRSHIDALANQHQGQLGLRDLMALLCKDIDARSGGQARLQDLLGASHDPIEYMASEVAHAQGGERHWQSVLYKANDVIDYAWHKLSPEDRTQFANQYRHVFMARRIAIPLANAEKLLAMLQSGQLSVRSHVAGVSARGNGFDIGFSSPGGKAVPSLHVNALINATGMCLNVGASDNVLLRGIASPCEFGGVRQDFDNLRLLNGHDACELPIALLGSLSVGTFFWTNAMSVNSRLASKLGDAVAQRIARVAEQRRTEPLLAPS